MIIIKREVVYYKNDTDQRESQQPGKFYISFRQSSEGIKSLVLSDKREAVRAMLYLLCLKLNVDYLRLELFDQGREHNEINFYVIGPKKRLDVYYMTFSNVNCEPRENYMSTNEVIDYITY